MSTAAPTSPRKTAVVIGVGPGLGMSIAHRFGREGYAVALISRSDARHGAYITSLEEAGAEARAFTADVRDREHLLRTLDTIVESYGSIDAVYYGPASTDPAGLPTPIDQADADGVREAMTWVYPALDVVGHVLPAMLERGDGALLFAGGLSAVMPMPALGQLAVSSAALRNYAVTLNAGLADKGVYAGNLAIGGLIERGDIHTFVTSNLEQFGDVGDHTLNPDEIADAAWELYAHRDRAEATFSTFG